MVKGARGIDVGTAFMVSAGQTDNSDVEISSVRDCFLSIPLEQAPMLEMSGISFVQGQDNLYVVGSDAVELAGALGGEIRRPLSRGFISSKEEEGKAVVSLILEKILGKGKSEIAAFSVPGPIFENGQVQNNDLNFHTRFFQELINNLGFNARPINEAVAVTYSETMNPKNQDEIPLTALSISLGAGMINVALTYKSLPVRVFSIPFGGDFIDEGAAKATNSSISHITMLKEHGVDAMTGKILDPDPSHDAQSERQAEAISLMYKELVTKLVTAVNEFFALPANRTEIKETIPVIYSGGTSLIKNFDKLFNDIFMRDLSVRFPVGKARSAQYPLDATSRGALNFGRLLTAKKNV
jgi:actin-like ATPase involved in cell morphogenesis